MEPGIYPNLTYEEYDAIDAFRSGELRTACLHGLRAYKRKRMKPEGKKYCFDFGRAFHAQMEPGIPDIIEGPKTPYSKEWNTLQRKNPEATIIKQGELALVEAMRRAVSEHPSARSLYEGVETEVTIVWICPATKQKLKARIDQTCQTAVVDWKTARDVHPRKIRYEIRDKGYDIQAAMIRDGLSALGMSERYHSGIFNVFVEKETVLPDVVVYKYKPAELSDASERYRNAITAILQAQATGFWPGIHDEILETDRFDEEFESFGEVA
ncbi:PD-(D/E)XK nuclease-like domain-containing protein [Cerasicoccus frondis]|uniref:PD-(D/E)XK nuclease-like domain-containing protein n=1 Tax=Cerasicoccus frondis TaxID=490090 RepID=UPI0028526D12|nr:PD-(D/E)XK nuclease-like domain-containing protein [Cerasicoccus frondis]